MTPDIVERLRELLERCGPYLPLRLEEDWTWEITGAEGSIVAKCPYPKPHAAAFASLFVEAANNLPALLAEIDRLRAGRAVTARAIAADIRALSPPDLPLAKEQT